MKAAPMGVREPAAFANGVRRAVLHRPGAGVTTVSVWILAGSRHERVPGVAHLLEHVLMQSVPAGRTARVIDGIEASGGDANAVTARDRLNASDLVAWSRRHVRPATLGVVVCGGLTAREVHTALAGGALAEFSAEGRAADRPADSSPPIAAGRADLPIVSDTAAVVIGGQGFALRDRRLLAAQLVIELLAGGNAAVLQQELRSRRGLCYDLYGGAHGYRETGSWRIAISAAPEHREDVVGLTTGLLTRAVRTGWTAEQVRRAGRRVAGSLLVRGESSLEEALLYGEHALVGDAPGFCLASHAAALAAVPAAEVNQAAEIMTDRLVVATAGGCR